MKKSAIFVGLNEFDPRSNITALRFAENDARRGAKVFRDLCGFETTVLVGKDATKGNIYDEIERQCKKLDPEDTFLLAMCTHGQTRTVDNGKRHYFAVYDSRLSKPDTYLDQDLLLDAMGDLPALQRIVLLDACKLDFDATQRGSAANSLDTDLTRDFGLRLRETHQVDGAPAAVCIVTACKVGEAAYEDPDLQDPSGEFLGHGVFMGTLLNAIEDTATWERDVHGNNVLEIRALAAKVQKQIGSKRPIGRGKQTPTYTQDGDASAIILAFRPAPVPPQPVEPPKPEPVVAAPASPEPAVEPVPASVAVDPPIPVIAVQAVPDAPVIQDKPSTDTSPAQPWGKPADADKVDRTEPAEPVLKTKGAATVHRPLPQRPARDVGIDIGILPPRPRPRPKKNVGATRLKFGLAAAAIVVPLVWNWGHIGPYLDGNANPAPSSRTSTSLASSGASTLTARNFFDAGESLYRKQEYAASVSAYRTSMEMGDPNAPASLGRMYYFGFGVTQDYDEAVRLYKIAADLGSALGQNNLAVATYNGLGVSKQPREAVRLWRLAADQGNAVAQSNLGNLYLHGNSVPQSDEEAFRLYEKSAAQGNPDGQTGLAFLYYRGRGVEKDGEEAARLYRLAADQGSAHGQYGLASLYLEGTAVPRNEAEAKRLMELAAAQGHADAKAWLESEAE
jgi:TPR repeat protein